MRLYLLTFIAMLNWVCVIINTSLALKGDDSFFIPAAIWLLAAMLWTTSAVKAWRDA